MGHRFYSHVRQTTRRGRLLSIVLVLALAVVGCGGGDAGGRDDVGGEEENNGEELGEQALTNQGFPNECPTTSESFRLMNETAYQVFGQIDFQDPQTGQPAVHHMFIGTAWAVGDRLLATNAHVTEAYNDSAQQGIQFSRALAVQSGTGTVIRLLRGLTHPDYSGDPLRSPDVGLFTAQEALPTVLELAPSESVVDLGDEFHLTGFPGDVEDFLTVTPGETVPQATSLTGTISARRSHDDSAEVTLDTLDVYQHQAPTTPGTSGSAMLHCGLVFAVNNAGTVQLTVAPGQDGQSMIQRTAAASNNFGVHVRHIHEIVELFEDNALQGFELPVTAVAQPPATNGGGGSVDGGGTTGGGGGGGTEGQQQVLTFEGFATGSGADHLFVFQVSADGSLVGLSDWSGSQYELSGIVDLNTGQFEFVDNGPELAAVPRGFYQGVIAQDGSFQGTYAEEGSDGTIPISGQRTG